jgi:DNA-binding FrmR family transcriptional regulator
MNMTDPKVLSRLARVEGQVRALSQMLKDERYCLDVVTQIRAARAGLAKVEQMILAGHLTHCIEHAITSGDPDEQRKKMAELIELLGETER